MRLFFYGTLLDPDIQALVLGRALDARDWRRAELRHFRRVYIAGRRYPMLLPHRGGAVDGIVVDRLGREDMARLCRYEGEGYRMERHAVVVTGDDGQSSKSGDAAWLFRGRPTVRPSTREWCLAPWQARHKAAYLREVRDWLASLPIGAVTDGPP